MTDELTEADRLTLDDWWTQAEELTVESVAPYVTRIKAAARREALLEARDYLSEQEQFDAAELVRTMITTEETA